MLSRSDHFSSLAMFLKLFNSSKPELATAKLTKQQFWLPLKGLAAKERQVSGCEAPDDLGVKDSDQWMW
jgi:hypothetical protein